MTKSKGSTAPARNDSLKVVANEGDNVAEATAASILAPQFRHAVTNSQVHKAQFGSLSIGPGFADYAEVIAKHTEKARSGDLSALAEIMTAQVLTLDNVFTEAARRMALNMGEYLGASETYGRIAFKAQSQCRATFETLQKLHQPREQTVRHVHVNEGGQAVIADQFHNHLGGSENGKSNEQSHATGASGASAALPCPDPLREGLPSPGRKWKTKVPNARRD